MTAGVSVPAAHAAPRRGAPASASAAAGTVYNWHLAQLDDPTAPPDVPDPIGNASAQIQSEVDDYNSKAQALQTQSANLANDENSLQQRETDLENQANQVTSQESDLEGQVTSIESQITDLNNQISAHNAEPHEFELPEQQAAYDAYNAEADALNSRRSALQSQAASIQSNVTNLQNAETSIQTKQTQLQTDVQTHNDAVEALQGQAADLDGERQKILGDVATLEQEASQPQDAAPYEDTPGGDAAEPADSPEAGADQGPPDTVQSEPAISGGDSAEPGDTTYEPATGDGSGSGSAPSEPVTETPVRATLSPDAVRSLPAGEAAHLDPTTTYEGLVPEADGDYAVTETEPPAGQSLPPGQKAFDDAIENGGKATAEVGGKQVTIDHVDPVQEAPSRDVGGDTARPAPRAAGSPEPEGPGPAVSLNQLQSDMDELGLGDEASKFDLEYSKTITDADGEPSYGDVPRDASGNPELGPNGKPILRFSELGLQNPTVAEDTFAEDDLEYNESGPDPCLEHSFSGATRVLMADGSTEPIAAVKAGDRIENAQPGGANQVHSVDEVHVTTTDSDFVDVVLSTPQGVRAVTSTENHPYYDLSTAAFVDAGSLLPGDRLQSGTGGSIVVRAVRAHVGPMVTYDLTIDGLHTYYVVAGDTPVLVHNVGECPADPTVLHGKLGEMAEEAEMKKEGYTDIVDQVRFKDSKGDVFIADLVGKDPATNDWEAVEVKTGAGAKLTQNQLNGYPELQGTGAVLDTSRVSQFGLNQGDFVKMPVRIATWECPHCGSVVP
ncbi:polymorphic toxin-type HINT domain-containing protein [Catenulispora pinistramenti]|uniref:polymorphic toxin-type HINT domain-containing protein n=1 Tax=Catenulispora pinistramenti TaxID=2705254 RepID=UPI001BAB9F54|nr:polymorphic toxin-type HINT domain-containing protein [Catenulispora pinistramenti]